MEEIKSKVGPKVILASMASLESGFAQQCLHLIVEDPLNSIILTDRSESNSLTRKLFHRYMNKLVDPWDISIKVKNQKRKIL